ncbi:MAG: site-specific DNA-methyltransferase [Rhodocyclaceae bacterium]|nr:site-specific DNA-methyltransferase [Rhodocyclaceae bacterium]
MASTLLEAQEKSAGSVMAKNKTYEKVIGDDAPFDPSFLFSICVNGVVFGANYFPHALPTRGQWIVWDKGRPEGTTFSDAELAWTSGTGIAVKTYRCVWNGMVRRRKNRTNVPTEKPIKLMSEIVNDFSNIDDIIFEPFSGSGTTIIAAEQTGRCCYAIELNPAYVDVAVKRWQEFTGGGAVLEDGRDVQRGCRR